MYISIELLDNGTDWLVAGALSKLVSFEKLKKATRYVRVKTTIKKLAEMIHKRTTTVKDSLYRLQDESRLQIVTDPKRGINTLLVNIGIDTKGKSKTKVLFSQSLTPDYLFEISIKNAKNAKTDTAKRNCLVHALYAMVRSDHPEKEIWIKKLKQLIDKLKSSQGKIKYAQGTIKSSLGKSLV